MHNDPLTPVPSERLLGPGYGQGVWPLRERLALATALLDVDNQQGSWAATSRRMMCFSRPGRPSTWCSSKACAKQYALLLDSIELVKRQKMPGSDSQSSQLSLAERVVKRLSAERAEELRSRIRCGQRYYSSLKSIISDVESGMYDSQLTNLLNVMNSISDFKMQPEVLDGEFVQTAASPNNDLSHQQTFAENDASSELQSKQLNQCSNKLTTENNPVNNKQSLVEFWKEIQKFYHIPDSTWYCAPGPINNRNFTGGYGSVTSRSRPSGVGSLNFSRLSTLLAEASSPALKPATQFRNSTNKSSSYKSSSHEIGHTTAVSRAAEAAKQRYLSKTSKHKLSSATSQPSRINKSSKKDSKSKHWPKKISRNNKYDYVTTSSSTSKEDHVNQDITRKSQPSDCRLSHQKSYNSIYKKSESEKQEPSDSETEQEDEGSTCDESSTDKQIDTPSSTPSTVAMCMSDVEDFLIRDDEKSEKTIANDDNATNSTLDNDRPATTIPDEDGIDGYNSESEKLTLSSDAVSSLSTEAVGETDCQVEEKISISSSPPVFVSTTNVPGIVAEVELKLDNLNQKSPVGKEFAISNESLPTGSKLNETNNDSENETGVPIITDLHCSTVSPVNIKIPVENLTILESKNFMNVESKMAHEVINNSHVTESSNVGPSTSKLENGLDKKLGLSSNFASQRREASKPTSKKAPSYSILPFLIKTGSNKSSQIITSDEKCDMKVKTNEKLDLNVCENMMNECNTDQLNTPVMDSSTPIHSNNESVQLNNSSISSGFKNHSLRLRLSRQGSQLIVLPLSDSTDSSFQSLNTSPKEAAFDNECHDTSWYSWANQLLSNGERIVSAWMLNNESMLLSPRFKNHTSPSDLKELVHELLSPIISDLNNELIKSKLQFVHRLLSILAHTVMTRASNTIRNLVAMELYHQWSEQLQTNLSEPDFSSTPCCYNSKTPPSWSVEIEDNSLNTCRDPPTLTLASSSFNSSSSQKSSETAKSIPLILLEDRSMNTPTESGKRKRSHSSVEDNNDDLDI
uniref:Dentin sialophosphoprotein-like n=1 Tax=Schistosoma mansoni TaxID=6183 RepID=A0A5K4F0Z1_SCHMA